MITKFKVYAQQKNADIISRSVERSFTNQWKKLPQIDHPLFVIAIPGSIHLVSLCTRFIPKDVNIVLVANGLDTWEFNWLNEHKGRSPIYRLSRIIEHGRLIDILLNHYKQPFSILDYDCFVFEKTIFYEMQQISPETMLNSLFCYQNADLNLPIPETFFLSLNPAILTKIQKKYHVGSRIINFDEIPNTAKKQLAKIRITKTSMPEPYKKYFDTLRLIYCLGISEGFKGNFIKQLPTVSLPSDIIYHVGGSSHTSGYTSKWGARGAYFWRYALETCEHQDLRTYYQGLYGTLTPRDVLMKNTTITDQIEPGFFAQAEKIVNYHS